MIKWPRPSKGVAVIRQGFIDIFLWNMVYFFWKKGKEIVGSAKPERGHRRFLQL